MDMNPSLSTCEQVAGIDVRCCPSCHEDYLCYGYDMCTVEIDGREYEVCCEAARKHDDAQSHRDSA